MEMKLSSIEEKHIIQAAKYINQNGVPVNYLNNLYWVCLSDAKEYPFKYITRIAYKYAIDDGDAWLDFESTPGYRKKIRELGFKINYYKEGYNFFKKDELDHFVSISGKSYRTKNKEDVFKSTFINPLVAKINKWAELSQVEDFEYKKDMSWKWSGGFKTYLWIRLFKPKASGKVFFAVGVEEDGNLFMKIDCQRSNHTGGSTKKLETNKVEAIDQLLSKLNYTSISIDHVELEAMDWDELIERTRNHIYDHLAAYDDLESIVNEKVTKSTAVNNLIPSDSPDYIKSYFDKERKFLGYKTDWSKKQKVSKKLGMAGEKLVALIERDKLKGLTLFEEAEKVKKVLDGEGYDILSFDEKGNEIYIEVKTTTGNSDEPFYLSANEKAFCEEHVDKYIVYRLHNYSFVTNSSKYFKIKGKELVKLDFTPTNYEVSINSKK